MPWFDLFIPSTVSEIEAALLIEIEHTSNGMQEALQQFADARDKNMAAQKQLIALRAGRAE